MDHNVRRPITEPEERVCIDDLELIAKATEIGDLRGQVIYLPLR
jgi:hypothetical protein